MIGETELSKHLLAWQISLSSHGVRWGSARGPASLLEILVLFPEISIQTPATLDEG
jgi:hypothetical protein